MKGWLNRLINSLMLCALCVVLPATAQPSLWQYFKQTFVTSEGRVVDTYQANISHSEGQGYGLLLAVKYHDLAAFKRIWQWTQTTLQVRDDKLFAWKYREDSPHKGNIADSNNATDGDLLIAWALLRAAETWQQPQFKQQAQAIQRDLIEKTLVEHGGRLFLLPASYGFDHDKSLRLNPSYLVFPAYQAMANAFAGPWQRLLEDSAWLLEVSLHHDLALPSDWVTLERHTGRVHLDEQFSAEAIRVWLYAALANETAAERYPGFRYWQRFYQQQGHYPDRFDPKRLKFEGYAMPGYWAVSARVLEQQGISAESVWQQAHQRLLKEANNYYSTALYLLALPQNSRWLYGKPSL